MITNCDLRPNGRRDKKELKRGQMGVCPEVPNCNPILHDYSIHMKDMVLKK